MNILICPDSFKGSITSKAFCDIAHEVLSHRYADAHIIKKPLADGGENTLECIYPHLWNAEIVWVETVDPLQRPIKASYIAYQDTAYVELASSSGITLIEEHERDIMHSTTYGTGILIKHAIESGKKKIVLFVGGSATNDGGVGIVQALGVQFYNYDGFPMTPSPANFHTIEDIENTYLYSDIEFIIATDVNNTLLGENGATTVYGPQKGASEKTLPLLEEGLRYYAELIENFYGQSLIDLPGMGSAGGTPLSLVGLLNGRIVSAVDLILELIEYHTDFLEADIIITGEGKFDHQSLSGKIVGHIIKDCIKAKKKCYVMAGSRTLSIIYKNVTHIELKQGDQSIEQSMLMVNENLRKAMHDISFSLN